MEVEVEAFHPSRDTALAVSPNTRNMSVPGMARRYRGWVLGGAAAAAWLGSGTSLALAEGKKKDDASPYFDPEALERGAKALREINASPHAKQASQMLVTTSQIGHLPMFPDHNTPWMSVRDVTSVINHAVPVYAGHRAHQAAGDNQAAGDENKGG